MLGSVVFAFTAGFVLGNGLPYYLAGSMGIATNPSPFRESTTVNVMIGWIMFVVAVPVWGLVDTVVYPIPAYLSGAVGVLVVGLIHARLWRANPWRRSDRQPNQGA